MNMPNLLDNGDNLRQRDMFEFNSMDFLAGFSNVALRDNLSDVH
jgi:hypothetical protein